MKSGSIFAQLQINPWLRFTNRQAFMYLATPLLNRRPRVWLDQHVVCYGGSLSQCLSVDTSSAIWSVSGASEGPDLR